MKLPCYLVQDLLPLYKDHVCDEQTSADVAEHLSGCAACSALLAEMDTPPQETAVQEEQAAEAAEALSTVKKNLRARQVKITLVAVGGLLALICAFFGWRYWMMHSYVDLPAGDIDVEYRYGGSNWISIRHKDTGVYYTSLGFVTKYYEGIPIAFISVTQTQWDVLMQKLRDSRDAMIDIMNRFPEEETALREMERVFHSHVDKKEQPDEAFYINAASMMKTLKRQFPERFPRHFQLIAAVDRNWGIGNKGQMLTVIPADQKLFRQETMGKIIVMGYKTFLTFPAQRPLDGRINLILTKKKALSVKGAEICHSVEEALVRIDELKQEKHLTDVDVVIIGGESVYRQFLPFCETAQITWIDFSYVADTHMVDLEKEGWELVRRSGEQTFFNLCYEFREYRKLEKESF